MSGIPEPEAVRALVRALPDLDRKVLGGLVTLMIAEPARIRDQEWIAERFVHVAVVAHGFDVDPPTASAATSADVATIERYASERMPAVLEAAFALFVRTAEELRARGDGFTFDDARAIVLGYVAG